MFKATLSLLMIFSVLVYGQTTVSGTVLDSDGNPIPGVTVFISGTSQGTTTDFDGNYSIEAESDQVLVFSSLGFSTQNFTVGDQTSIDVSLEEAAEALDEIIVTGYGTETKRETTGAISTVKAKDLLAIPSGNIEQQFQGRIAGVTVISNGNPGTTSQIRVRGFGSFGGNAPLYIVDGVPVENIDFINPNDIASTTVLKDAASASIYGARAAGGVVVFTTKQGQRSAKPTEVTIDFTTGFTDPNVGGAPKMLSPQELADYTAIAARNNAAANGTTPVYQHPQYGGTAVATLPDYLYASGVAGGGLSASQVNVAAVQALYDADPIGTFLIKANKTGTNWYDAITRNAPLTRVGIGFQGGSEKGRFYIGVGSQSQDGVLINAQLRRHTVRVNSEYDITPWLSFGENIQATYRENRASGAGNGAASADDESQILAAYRMATIIPVYDEFGSYASTKAAGFNNGRNPVRILERNYADDNSYSLTAFGNLYLDFHPIPELNIRSSIGGNVSNYYYVDYGYRYLGDSEPQNSDTFGEGSGKNLSWTFTNTATYKRTFGAHTAKLLVGLEALNTGYGRNIFASGINPFSTDLDYINMNTVSNPVVGSGLYNGVTFYSNFAKLDYNFQEKYYVSGTIRRDGSSRFGTNERYGTFPAFSAAWRATDEPFLQGVSWLNELKIRGGWGEMGNSNNVDPANQFSLFGQSKGRSYYPIGGQNNGADAGYYTTRIGNPNAKWETSETTNIGFDATLFNGKLDVIVDVWTKDTKDLLYNIPLAATTGNGASAPSVNIAEMSNSGIDMQFITSGTIASGQVGYELSVIASTLKNEIVALAPGITYFGGNSYRGIAPIRNAIGQSLSAFYMYKTDGYFDNQAEVDAHASQPGAGIGRFKYVDTDGDGSITPDDRQFVGSPVPDFTGGVSLNLRYNNWSFNTYLYASLGNEIFHQAKWYTGLFGSFEGAGKSVLAKSSWTPTLGDNAGGPIWESASNLSTNGAANDWYMEDGSYLRIQNVSLNYDFDRSLVEKIGIKDLRIGISANNIATFTKYSGQDPSIGGVDTNFGVDTGNYPVTPSYLLSINIRK